MTMAPLSGWPVAALLFRLDVLGRLCGLCRRFRFDLFVLGLICFGSLLWKFALEGATLLHLGEVVQYLREAMSWDAIFDPLALLFFLLRILRQRHPLNYSLTCKVFNPSNSLWFWAPEFVNAAAILFRVAKGSCLLMMHGTASLRQIPRMAEKL